MAYNGIDSIVTGRVPLLQSYMTVPPVEQTNFFTSGVITPTNEAQQIANGPSATATIPFWNPIDASVEPNYSNDNPEDIAEPRAITTGSMQARVSYLNEAFGDTDLTREWTSTNPLQSVAARLDGFWRRQAQRRLIATTLGIYNDSVANHDGDMVFASGSFNANAFIDASVSLGMDDEVQSATGAIVVNRAVYAQMRVNNMIETIQDSELGEIETYQGRRVIIDSGLPIVTGDDGTTQQNLSILFGESVFGYGSGSPTVPEETERDPARANGGGVNVLWTRRTWLLHPFGYSFTGNQITGNGVEDPALSPSWSDLSAETNWDRVLDRAYVPISFIATNR